MIGYDVEGFIRDQSSNALVPAELMLSGSKEEPASLTKEVMCHPDNVMAEIASAEPFEPEELSNRIASGKKAINDFIGTEAFTVEWAPVGVFDASELERSVLANIIGCDVDWQGMDERRPPTIKALGNTRCAGGHLHFDLPHRLPPYWAAAVCDVVLATALISMGEIQGQRRRFYGLPSLYRPKPYGFEYRTLSNFWFNLTGDNLDMFSNLVATVARGLEEERESIVMLPHMYHKQAMDIISSEDSKKASGLVDIVVREMGI